ncbi:MAG: hypothetical protein JSR39_07530 [Verrucomicrobia bacterium]|nr:hypothetical protein [Verrucomicrobiota bacterium]
MDNTAAIVCHAFLQKCSPEQQNALLKYLPSAEAKEMRELGSTLGDPSKGFPRCDEQLFRIHYSWFAPYLRTLPESDIRLFFTCLHPDQQKGLKTLLLFSNQLPEISFMATQFLRQTLFDQITPPDLLPIACLPSSRLNLLLDLDKQEWSSLIDLISMHDLSIEIRHIIDTAKLKQIYALLSKPQQAYLKTLSHKKEPVAFKKLGLASWSGDVEALKHSLFQRGVNRIAKALYGHHPSLIWYVSHHLDIEKGNALLKLCTPLDHPRAAPLLIDQVVDLSQSINTHTPV